MDEDEPKLNWRDFLLKIYNDHWRECEHIRKSAEKNWIPSVEQYAQEESHYQWEWLQHEEFGDQEVARLACDHVDCKWRYEFQIEYRLKGYDDE